MPAGLINSRDLWSTSGWFTAASLSRIYTTATDRFMEDSAAWSLLLPAILPHYPLATPSLPPRESRLCNSLSIGTIASSATCLLHRHRHPPLPPVLFHFFFFPFSSPSSSSSSSSSSSCSLFCPQVSMHARSSLSNDSLSRATGEVIWLLRINASL